MRRCEHDSYLPKNCKTLSPYCGLCNPGLAIKNARNIILPVNGIGHPQKLRANGKNSGDCCPKCGSEIFTLTKTRSAVVECADCGTTYKHRNIRREDK